MNTNALQRKTNAALSGEQRDHNPKPLRPKHKTQPRAETPKRWESVLNAQLAAALSLANYDKMPNLKHIIAFKRQSKTDSCEIKT